MLRSVSLSVVLTVSAAALLALPCTASVHARHANYRAASVSHAAASHASSHPAAAVSAHYERNTRYERSSRYGRKAGLERSTHVERSADYERVTPVHHEPVPTMDGDRATAIQAALIHAGYLTGEPTGVWDADSVAAMQKMQDANGWQTKYTPDSRALVKLGLGPAPAASTPIATASVSQAEEQK